jgi:nucleoside-diphosphate-sugar epimerase
MRDVPKRHVFVTGATGYLGRTVIPELLARGHAVRVVEVPEIRASSLPT